MTLILDIVRRTKFLAESPAVRNVLLFNQGKEPWDLRQGGGTPEGLGPGCHRRWPVSTGLSRSHSLLRGCSVSHWIQGSTRGIQYKREGPNSSVIMLMRQYSYDSSGLAAKPNGDSLLFCPRGLCLDPPLEHLARSSL